MHHHIRAAFLHPLAKLFQVGIQEMMEILGDLLPFTKTLNLFPCTPSSFFSVP
jgi:hypothetical protein